MAVARRKPRESPSGVYKNTPNGQTRFFDLMEPRCNYTALILIVAVDGKC